MKNLSVRTQLLALVILAVVGFLALGGMVRVSQVQMVQPFLALLLAVPVLGEPLQMSTLVFAVAVVAVVFIGKRMAVHKEPRA